MHHVFLTKGEVRKVEAVAVAANGGAAWLRGGGVVGLREIWG